MFYASIESPESDSCTEYYGMTHIFLMFRSTIFLFCLSIFLSGDHRFFKEKRLATEKHSRLAAVAAAVVAGKCSFSSEFIIRMNRLLDFADAKLFYPKLAVEDIILHGKKIKIEKNGGKQSEN